MEDSREDHLVLGGGGGNSLRQQSIEGRLPPKLFDFSH